MYIRNRYVPHNDVSVNDGPHIRRRSHNIIILYYNTEARGGVVVKALSYKPAGRGFDS